MKYTRPIKLSILALMLALVLLTFSASTSSCETGSSYQLSGGGDYQSMARQDAIDAGIPPTYFVNQINAESHFNPSAISSAGAIGIAQFEPQTAASLGIDPWNAGQSLRGAANLMASYNAKYGDYKMSLAAYQCGPECLQSAINRCGYWYWCVPASTQAYISKITG